MISIHRTEFNIVFEWLFSILIAIFMFFILFFLQDNLPRLWLSIKSFGNNALYYFTQILDIKINIDSGLSIEEVLDVKGGFDSLKILPVNWEVFKQEIFTFFKLFINFSNYKDFFKYCLPFISDLCRLLIIVLPLFLVLYFVLDNYFEYDEERDVSNPSKNLLYFLKFKEKVLLPIKNFFVDIWQYLIYQKVYLRMLTFLFLYSINAFSIIIDFFGWYLYFVSSFELISIYEFLVIVFLDLGPFLVKVPFIIYLITFYIIFDKIRINIAYKKMAYMEAYDMGFVNSLGSYTFIKGGPGSGKTKTMTNFQLCAEEIIRNRLFDNIKEVGLEFPDFDFSLLEKEMKKEINDHKIFNHYQAKAWIETKVNEFLEDPDNNSFFDYDFKNNKFEFNNGLYVENLFEAISDYAQSYYLYSMNCPLSCANYSIRHSGQMIFNGYFEMWSYDWIHENPEFIDYSNNSKILDFNSFRIQKKLNTDKTNSYTLDGCVVAMTEIDKERRNQFYTNKLDKDDLNANQLNDGFNDYGKMKRHDCTIRNKLIFMSFMDCQREGSVNSDLVDINEYMITIHKQDSDWESSLFMFWLEPMIIESIISFRNNLYYRFRLNRDDKTLLVYLLNKLTYYLNKYLVKRKNTFNYQKMELDITNGVDSKKQTFYLMSKKIYSRRYSTNCYSSFFEEKYLEADIGFIDLPSFNNYVPSIDELKYMNSYFIRDMESILTEGPSYSNDLNNSNDLTY